MAKQPSIKNLTRQAQSEDEAKRHEAMAQIAKIFFRPETGLEGLHALHQLRDDRNPIVKMEARMIIALQDMAAPGEQRSSYAARIAQTVATNPNMAALFRTLKEEVPRIAELAPDVKIAGKPQPHRPPKQIHMLRLDPKTKPEPK